MKKVIVTLCSLALTVASTLGVNQLSLNNTDTDNPNSDYTSVAQYADNAVEQNSLTDDKRTETTSAVVKEAAAEAEVAAPTAKTKDEAKTTAMSKTEIKTKAEAMPVAKATNLAVAQKNDDVKKEVAEVKGACDTAAVTEQPQATTINNEAVKALQNANQNSASSVPVNQSTDKGNQNTVKVIPVSSNQSNNSCSFGNIDLSQCNSVQDVVKVLQQNGFNNINLGNVNQISSLEDILALINCNNGNSNTATPAPTTTPEPTAKPEQAKPTTTPEPTAKPEQAKPTTTPEPTAKPEQAKPTTAPEPTKAPESNTNTSISSYADQVLQLVNQERAKEGLSALTTNATLQAAAEQRAQETVQSFSHTRPNGTSFSTVLKEYGISYRAAGENIAYGQRTPQEVVNAWMNSSGHRANIMNANFGKIGIGVYQKNGVIYWSQLFTN